MSENNKSINNMLNNPNQFYKNTKGISDIIKIEEQKREYLSILTRTEGEGIYPFEKGVLLLKAAIETEDEKKQK
ncbi:MAG: hypothetical protein ACKKMW_02295 [Candidatus Nealsonbacteria bacterium]